MSNNRQFKKGEVSGEAYDVLMHDLQSLDLRANPKDNDYHYELLKGNLRDIFGVEE